MYIKINFFYHNLYLIIALVVHEDKVKVLLADGLYEIENIENMPHSIYNYFMIYYDVIMFNMTEYILIYSDKIIFF